MLTPRQERDALESKMPQVFILARSSLFPQSPYPDTRTKVGVVLEALEVESVSDLRAKVQDTDGKQTMELIKIAMKQVQCRQCVC